MGYQLSNGHVMTSRDPRRCCEAIRPAILATAWFLVFFGRLMLRHRLDCFVCAQAGELNPLCFDLRNSSNRSKSRPNRLLSLFSLRRLHFCVAFHVLQFHVLHFLVRHFQLFVRLVGIFLLTYLLDSHENNSIVATKCQILTLKCRC